MKLAWLLVIAACSKSTPDDIKPAPAPKHEDRHDPQVAAPALTLAVAINGAESTWHQDVFDKVPHFASTNNDGEARDTWSLRELVHRTVGPTARVVAVVGSSRKAIDAAAWDDATRTPILHTTRRGTLKFRWTDKDGKWGETEVKDVVRLELAR